MRNKGSKISSSLALATAAFLSMPSVAKAQEFSPCAALRTGRVPAKVRIEAKGPWPLRTDDNGNPVSGYITTNFWNSSKAMDVRVGAEVVDVRLGVRVRCLDTSLRAGEGAALRMDFDAKDLSTTGPLLGIRIIVVPDPNQKIPKKAPLPFVSGTVQSNVLYNNENLVSWD